MYFREKYPSVTSVFDRHRQPFHLLQKQPSRGILRKRCSENMEQIYMRTTVPMFDFSIFAMQRY